MGRRILASLLSMALIFALPVFSLADDSTANLKNSGSVDKSVSSTAESTEISMKAMRSVAASEGVLLMAAEGDSGQFGYNIEPFPVSPYLTAYRSDYLTYYEVFNLPAGTYIYSLEMVSSFSVLNVYNFSDASLLFRNAVNTNDAQISFTLDSPTVVQIVAYNGSGFDSNSFVKSSISTLKPVEGISSGYTYSSGIIPRSTRSIFETLDCSFGNQPAGKYLINIYHWGDSYDVNFQISDSSDSYYLPTSTDGGVTTLVYNHPGGDFTLGGNFTVDNIETSVSDGYYATSGNSTTGDVDFYGSLSWVFNITDIVAIPYEQAADSNFGFFAPIIGFFNDHFSSMKAWIATQIDKIAGDDETQADVDQAQDSLNKEVEELGQLSTDLTTQTGNLEQQFTTDFAIPSEVLGQTGAVQQIYNFLFSSLGIFSIFIWLPVILAVIKKLLRL